MLPHWLLAAVLLKHLENKCFHVISLILSSDQSSLKTCSSLNARYFLCGATLSLSLQDWWWGKKNLSALSSWCSWVRAGCCSALFLALLLSMGAARRSLDSSFWPVCMHRASLWDESAVFLQKIALWSCRAWCMNTCNLIRLWNLFNVSNFFSENVI